MSGLSPEESERLCKRRLEWLSRQSEATIGAPLWLGALVIAFTAMDVDDVEVDSFGEILDRAEKARGLEPEAFFDFINDAWRHK